MTWTQEDHRAAEAEGWAIPGQIPVRDGQGGGQCPGMAREHAARIRRLVPQDNELASVINARRRKPPHLQLTQGRQRCQNWRGQMTFGERVMATGVRLISPV